jgi:hypothetical protein
MNEKTLSKKKRREFISIANSSERKLLMKKNSITFCGWDE